MKLHLTILCLALCALAACSTPHGQAGATHKGAAMKADIFKLKFP